jgi:hypothetical protein
MTISIAGTLILNGDILTDEDVRVETLGTLIPVARDLKDTIYSCPIRNFISQNGKAPSITSTFSGNAIEILGAVNGIGQGFSANNGPGANSTLLSSQAEPSDIYGATHAGLGSVQNVPGTIELVQEDITVHTINIAQGGIDLTYSPVGDNVAVNVVHGPSQFPGIDYVLQGDFIRWSGYFLDSIIAVGDIVRVIYLADTSRSFPGPKNSYGSYEAPTSIGSGSGETSGGGGLKLIARNGRININGTINVSGESGTSSRSGGGSGGSLWASSYNLTGAGTIISEGGGASDVYAGGGGGGYITLDYENSNTFQGSLSVIGHKGGTHGITTVEKIEPFFQEKFTGTVLNPKWWEIAQEPVVINNTIAMDTTTGDLRNPRLESLFQISGKNMQVDCDFIPSGLEPSYHTSYFQLFLDDRNWVQVARKHNNIFGMFTVDGYLYQSAVPYDYTNATFRILKVDSTFTFQYVDSTAGPVTVLTETVPEFENVKFKVAIGTQKDDPDSSNFVSDFFKLTNIDDAQGYVTLSGIPLDASNVSLNVVGGSPQIYGTDYTVSGQRLYWNPLNLSLQEDDEIIADYANDTTFNDLLISWDNFKVFSGVLHGIESTLPTLYVDPTYGSDTSSGDVFSPLKNLFVATSWAKKGGTVVLYSGVYNPTEIERKNLTIMGANGSTAVITTASVQDTTGSNWENSCITLHDCQGIISNIYMTQAVNGVYAEDTWDLEVSNCQFDTSTGIRFLEYSQDCRVLRNTFHDSSVGVVFERQNYNPYVYSNVMHDMSECVQLLDASNFVVSSNTFDTGTIGIFLDGSSTGFIASNNLTNLNTGISVGTDSTVGIFNNNFFGTSTLTSGAGVITDYTNNIRIDPNYANQYLKNYHILAFSPDRTAGTGIFDQVMMDRDGAPRTNDPGYDIGAYHYVNTLHSAGDYFIHTGGDDYLNTGNVSSPFRNLDKAMSVTTTPVYITSSFYRGFHLNAYAVGNRFDSTFLELKEQNIYFAPNAHSGSDASIETFAIDSHYSNINLGAMLFVSPSGSDSTLMGGDGTNSGGDGSLLKPFRTLNRALDVASPGNYVIMLSGEYPLFNGRNGRIVVPTSDRTGLADGRMCFEDLFSTPPAMFPHHNIAEEVSWNLTATANSEASIREGYLGLTYDGTNAVTATSAFTFTPNSSDTTAFEVMAELRQAFDPISFKVYNGSNSLTFKYFGGDYTCSLYTGGELYNCWGHLNTNSPVTDYFTDYACISSEDILNKYISLTYLIDNPTETAVNVVGGTAQELNSDFYIQDNKIKWDGMTLESEINPGDVLRVMYHARGLSDPVRVKFILKDSALTIMGVDNGHFNRLMKRAVHSDPTGAWNASFYMDSSNVGPEIGRGYVSKFLAIAESFSNTEKAKPYQLKTWRQPVIVYK